MHQVSLAYKYPPHASKFSTTTAGTLRQEKQGVYCCRRLANHPVDLSGPPPISQTTFDAGYPVPCIMINIDVGINARAPPPPKICLTIVSNFSSRSQPFVEKVKNKKKRPFRRRFPRHILRVQLPFSDSKTKTGNSVTDLRPTTHDTSTHTERGVHNQQAFVVSIYLRFCFPSLSTAIGGRGRV